MNEQLAIVWLMSLATCAVADEPLIPSNGPGKHLRGSIDLKWARQQEKDLDLANLFTPLGFSSDRKFAYFIGYNCSESDSAFEGQLEVLDLTDNRIVFEKSYEDD